MENYNEINVDLLPDRVIVQAILQRNKDITYKYFYKKCYPLFKSVYLKYYTDCEIKLLDKSFKLKNNKGFKKMDSTEGAVTPAQRHKARHFAMQAIYQWQLTGLSSTEIEKQFLEDQPMKGTDLDYFHDLVSGVINNVHDIDIVYAPYLSRPLDDLDQVDKAVLRLGTFELMYRQEVPYRVVINEAIILAKEFAEQDSHKFVNGVLDKVVKSFKAH